MLRGFQMSGWALAVLSLCLCKTAAADPVLKGALPGEFQFDADTGLATFEGFGRLTLMGRTAFYGEILFEPGEAPGTLEGAGVCVFIAANGDALASTVKWRIDEGGESALVFRWPGEVTFSDGTTVESTGRFVEVPFGGLRGTIDLGDGFINRSVTSPIIMNGEIVDPDPIDF